jgi:hypothetical protein
MTKLRKLFRLEMLGLRNVSEYGMDEVKNLINCKTRNLVIYTGHLETQSLLSSVVWWLACLPLDPRFAGSNPAKGDKSPQHTFIRRESKAVGPMS